MSDMENEEYHDDIAALPQEMDMELLEQIMRAKKGEPNRFASYWEKDENDIDEATEAEIQNNPSLKLLWAAENGKLEVVEELLAGTPELVCCTDADGYTPLHRAAYNNHQTVAHYLLSHGANIEAKTSDGWTPLHSASYWGNAKMAADLLASGSNINAQTNGKQTALHLAASNSDSMETLQVLLMNPFIDFTLTNSVGETAKQLAERNCKYHFLFEIADHSINQLSP